MTEPCGFTPQMTQKATSHNPEVAGSNPAPATEKALETGPFSWDTPRTKLLLAGALLVLLVAPSAAAPAATDIVVTTNSDATNGDVATAAGLIANPGPDGVSLREALEATNNDPGTYTIGFAPALAGKTITLVPDLPPLTGGGVTVEGDIDGNGKPDVTLRPSKSLKKSFGFTISSSGNRLHALMLRGFVIGVFLQPDKRVPSHRTYEDNVVSGLVMQAIGTDAIKQSEAHGFTCGLPAKARPCPTYNVWANTVLTGNTIEADQSGIRFGLYNSFGDRVEGLTVTGNTIRIGAGANADSVDVGISVQQGGNSTRTLISDVLIARNSIEGVHGGGISVGPGAQRASANTMQGVQILDNRIHLVRRGSAVADGGIIVGVGSDQPYLILPSVRPVRYPDGNVLRNVQVRGNSISGALAAGVDVQAGIGAGGSRNRIENVRIERNVIRSSIVARGVWVWMGSGSPYKNRYATGNRITGVTIDGNRVTIGSTDPGFDPLDFQTLGGIVLLGGGTFGRGGVVRDVKITKNRIATAQFGIRLVGGSSRSARRNSVTCVRVAGNRITGTRKAVP